MRFFANAQNDFYLHEFEGKGAWWRHPPHQAPFLLSLMYCHSERNVVK